jgi:hypothetical protein
MPLGEELLAPDADLHGDFAGTGQALARLLGADNYSGWPLTVVLDDTLTRLWQVELPQGAKCMADIEAAAALRFQSLYGDAPDLWQSSRAWAANAPFFCAVPRALLAQIERVAVADRLVLIAITPRFVMSWNRWQGVLEPGAWFGQLHGQTLTLGVVHDDRLRAVRAIAVPPGAPSCWLEQTLAREALLQGLPVPGLLQLSGAPCQDWLAQREDRAFSCSVFAQDGSLA